MRNFIVWLALIGGMAPGLVAALSTDRNQPMYVEADRADIDDKRGVSVYRGNVKITQGTLQLTAAELTVHSKNGDIVKAIAVGQPATYRQRPDGKEKDVEAEALRMEYFAHAQKITLLDKAEVRQAGDTFRSDEIHYDIAKDVVNAGGSAGTPGDRVRITIQPKTKPAAKDATPAAEAPATEAKDAKTKPEVEQ
ncbi:MAG: lipopolysaccharide transport periplasmic protein LptA [Gammaproteobacteria bacterium]|nr:lipopolysaccharide transport periplasmic protein LptA [Gammaproteobacteria bacterium]